MLGGIGLLWVCCIVLLLRRPLSGVRHVVSYSWRCGCVFGAVCLGLLLPRRHPVGVEWRRPLPCSGVLVSLLGPRVSVSYVL